MRLYIKKKKEPQTRIELVTFRLRSECRGKEANAEEKKEEKKEPQTRIELVTFRLRSECYYH